MITLKDFVHKVEPITICDNGGSIPGNYHKMEWVHKAHQLAPHIAVYSLCISLLASGSIMNCNPWSQLKPLRGIQEVNKEGDNTK